MIRPVPKLVVGMISAYDIQWSIFLWQLHSSDIVMLNRRYDELPIEVFHIRCAA
jgi:hypothetical protein